MPAGEISIHALREESDRLRRARYRRHGISIHALREESDPAGLVAGELFAISIHALREESDFSTYMDMPEAIFQSTLSVRRAT